jgi:subtilase family serine protease
VIAIVDANHAPNAMADLNVFSQNFGSPLVDSTSFQVVYATSAGTTTSTPPAYDSGWEMEISLDIQWAHAMAPNAKIILVEANSANLSDMFAAVSLAASLVTAGSGGQVSLSWGRVVPARREVHHVGSGEGRVIGGFAEILARAPANS